MRPGAGGAGPPLPHSSGLDLAVWERAQGTFEAVLDAPLRDPAVYGELPVVASDLGIAVDP